MLGESLMHGWPGVFFGYAAVQLPMVAGLVRGGGAWHRYITSPLVAAPLMALVGGAMSISAPLLSYLGSVRGVAEFALGTSMSALLGYAGGRTLANDALPGDSHRRGAVVAERPADVVRQPGPPSPTITVAGRAAAYEDETKHFKLIGTTGTGKSTAIREMLSAALARGDRAVIADPDGGYLRRFFDENRGDTILNPFDERSVKWDLFSEIKTPYDVEQLARSLIPDHEGSDRSWRGYARTFFGAVTRQAYEGGVTDTAELYRLMVVADRTELRALVKGTPRAAVSRRAQQQDVRLDPLRHERGDRPPRIHCAAKRNGPFDPLLGRRRSPWRALHALQRRTDRRIALDDLCLDAPRDLRGHGSARARSPGAGPNAAAALVRGG